MTALVFATFMTLPLYPLNPTGQDTINYMNLHVTAGLNGPSPIVSAGPDLTVKYELMIHHPFIVRAAFDYRYGSISSPVYTDGDLHRGLFSLEAIYYRGTDNITGYIGAGPVYSMNNFNISANDADSLFNHEGVTSVGMSDAIGYRITAGLRVHRTFSVEIGLTDTRPDFQYTSRVSPVEYSITSRDVRFNDFRVSFGYLFTLKM